MSEQEKQIEEIAEIINSGCDGTNCRDCKFFTKELKDKYYCLAMFTAERLYNGGYRKERQGEWLTNKYKTMERAVCSICNAVYEGDGENYCPNCGAKMKGNE